jgi:hypothetical protein
MFAATAPIIPVLATFASITAYVCTRFVPRCMWIPNHALLVGALVALTMWLVGPMLYLRKATAEFANPRAWHELQNAENRLDKHLSALIRLHPELGQEAAPLSSATHGGMSAVAADHHEPGPQEAEGLLNACQGIAFAEARVCDLCIQDQLARAGLQWVMGTGYLDLWSILHRAEEALILILPEEVIVTGALYDLDRLIGSTIADKEHLIGRLSSALVHLRPSILKIYPHLAFLPMTPMGTAAAGKVADGTATAPQPSTTATSQEANSDTLLPRLVLQEVRYSINRFRDDSWDGLVRSRNRLVQTIFFTGLTMYILTWLAISMGVPRIALGTLAVYYGAGAVAGLFNRLYLDARSNLAVEDYGLFTARLIHTPLLSGLAALGGIVITSVTDSGLTNAPHSAGLQFTAGSFVTAGLFGLTPGLLISRLQQQTEQYKQDLKSSDVTQRTST